jgi:hypothetical protein
MVDFLFGTKEKKYVTLNMIGLLQRPFCWSLTPNLLTRKIAVKPCMNRKIKIWWCFILHETVGNTEFPGILFRRYSQAL